MADEQKFKKVVGLQYDPQRDALPKIILKGSGRIADEILQSRNSLNSHKVVEDAELVNQLFKLPIDAEITPDLYEIVAIVLGHVFSINHKLKERNNERYVFGHSGSDA